MDAQLPALLQGETNHGGGIALPALCGTDAVADVSAGEEQRLAAKYSSFFKLLEKLSDRDIEDVYWVIKRKVEGLL